MIISFQIDEKQVRMTANFKYLLNDNSKVYMADFTNYEAFESICTQTMVGMIVVEGTKNDIFRCIIGEKIDPVTK